MKASLVTIGDVAADLRSGFASGEDDPTGIVQFRMNNVGRNGEIRWDKLRRVPRSKAKSELLVQSGDILFNATNSPELVGKTAFFSGFTEPVTFSNHFVRIRSKRNVAEPAYVARWLQREFERGRFAGMCRSWVNQASITKDQLTSLSFPLPPLDKQRRIAAILDKADALRRQRQRALELLDSLTQSIFLEQFGDPLSNPKLWPRKPIGELCKVVTGNTPPRNQPSHYGSTIEWIKSDNIDARELFVSRAAEYLSETGRAVARVVPAGSTLITCIAGSPNSIGNAGMTNREVAFNQQINALIPIQLDPFFLSFQIRIGKRLVQDASTGGMKGLVSKSRLAKVMLISPPRKLQEKFSRQASRLITLNGHHRRHFAQTNALFLSLQSRAFSGQL